MDTAGSWSSGQVETEGGRKVFGRFFVYPACRFVGNLSLPPPATIFLPRPPSIRMDSLHRLVVQNLQACQHTMLPSDIQSRGYCTDIARLGCAKSCQCPCPAAAMNIDRRLVIAWDAHSSDAAQTDIYTSASTIPTPWPNRPRFLSTPSMSGRQENPSVSLADSGNFVIVWQSENSDGDDFGICGGLSTPTVCRRRTNSQSTCSSIENNTGPKLP